MASTSRSQSKLATTPSPYSPIIKSLICKIHVFVHNSSLTLGDRTGSYAYWYPPYYSSRKRQETTVISRRDINPSKLEGLLEKVFRGSYEVELRHDTFKVIAQRQLSQREINDCAP